MGRAEVLRIQVALSRDSRRVECTELGLPSGSTVRDALRACELLGPGDALPEGFSAVGVWGRVAGLDTPLCDGDRVELFRPLRVDPKQARRQRYRAQGERGRAPRRPLR